MQSYVSYRQNLIVAVKIKQVVKNFLLDLPGGVDVLYTDVGPFCSPRQRCTHNFLKILEDYVLFN